MKSFISPLPQRVIQISNKKKIFPHWHGILPESWIMKRERERESGKGYNMKRQIWIQIFQILEWKFYFIFSSIFLPISLIRIVSCLVRLIPIPNPSSLVFIPFPIFNFFSLPSLSFTLLYTLHNSQSHKPPYLSIPGSCHFFMLTRTWCLFSLGDWIIISHVVDETWRIL